MTEVPSPAILPPFVSRCSVVVDFEADWDDREVPPELRQAVRRRQMEFLAGRACARRALGRLAPELASAPLRRQPGGEPAWPQGFIGSITHAGDFVSAAVARSADLRGLGIDSERLERFAGSSIGRTVMLPEDAAACRELDAPQCLPLVFAAKEAIFKCLYPLVGVRFWFDAAVLTAVGSGEFSARLTGEQGPGVGPDLPLLGRYAFDAGNVHAAVWLGESLT